MKNQALIASSAGRTCCRHGGRWIALLSLALVTTPVFGQDRVGQLSKASGDVKITRAKDGKVDEPQQRGPRVFGGSVSPGDVIATGAGASATLVLSDDSLIDLAASTRISVEERDQSALVAAGKRDRPIGRTIKVFAGDIFSEIAENPNVATEFETPSGVAAVKGTKLSISVGQAGGG